MDLVEIEELLQNGTGDSSRHGFAKAPLDETGDSIATGSSCGSARSSQISLELESKKPLEVGDHERNKRPGKRGGTLKSNSRGGEHDTSMNCLQSSNKIDGNDSYATGYPVNYVVSQRRWKNSRRPRNGFKRGLPKKGGAGGKGVWGRPGSEAFAEELYEDEENDPNYDSEVYDENIEFLEVIPDLTPEEFFKLAEPIVLEYYEHGDTHEVAVSFDEILTGQLREYVTSVVTEIAMDHKDSQREMTSVLISDLYGRVVTGRDIEKGFEMLLNNLPDLTLDTPDAPLILGNFLARAVADDCIAPKFISNPQHVDLNNNQHAVVALRRANTLLHMKLYWAHLDNVWSMAGPLRPVESITKQMSLLLQEYLSSRDLKEAHRCLRALEVPHFHHELIFMGIIMTLESLNPTTEELMCELFRSLNDACLVLTGCIEQGFLRIFDEMDDIVLDVPRAYIILRRFLERCKRAGFLTRKILNNVPVQAKN